MNGLGVPHAKREPRGRLGVSLRHFQQIHPRGSLQSSYSAKPCASFLSIDAIILDESFYSL